MVGEYVRLTLKPKLWKQGEQWHCASVGHAGFFRAGQVVHARGNSPGQAYNFWRHMHHKNPLCSILGIKL